MVRPPPGDTRIEGEHIRIYVPVTSMLVVSVFSQWSTVSCDRFSALASRIAAELEDATDALTRAALVLREHVMRDAR